MRQIKVAVVDDDKTTLKIVSNALVAGFTDNGFICDAFAFLSPGRLLKEMLTVSFDIIILDIELNGQSGIDVARGIREKDKDQCIMFISSHEDLVFDALSVNPLAFIRKNKFISDIGEAIKIYMNFHAADGEDYLAETTEGTKVVKISDVLYIEGCGHYQMMYTAEEAAPMQLRTTLTALEEIFIPKGFLRIHKGYLVNYKYIKQINRDGVVINGGKNLPISRNKYKEIRAKFLALKQGGVAPL